VVLIRESHRSPPKACEDHHLKSIRTLGLGDLCIKGDEIKLKDAVKREMEGRCERPSGTANEQCTRVPRTDSASFLENFWPSRHGFSFDKYLSFFCAGI
jgi:hypothetical protein